MILIITIKDDLHALAVQSALKKMNFNECHILECDYMSSNHCVHWHIGSDNVSAKIKLHNNYWIDIKDIKLIWWRRVRADQKLEDKAFDATQNQLINNDCRGALSGILEASYKGKWLSDPVATDKASNKIYQLSVAKSCGFDIPETLISQSKNDVINFTNELNGQVIVKPVVGVAGPLMFTEFMYDPGKYDEESFSISPAVYQEYIPGTKHIRLNCFGNNFYAALIDSPDLDWRPNLNVPIHEWDVPNDLRVRVRQVLDKLGLEMGIIDIKITPMNEFIWLEVNPQGQFLFLEPIIKVPLTDIFAKYLISLYNNSIT